LNSRFKYKLINTELKSKANLAWARTNPLANHKQTCMPKLARGTVIEPCGLGEWASRILVALAIRGSSYTRQGPVLSVMVLPGARVGTLRLCPLSGPCTDDAAGVLVAAKSASHRGNRTTLRRIWAPLLASVIFNGRCERSCPPRALASALAPPWCTLVAARQLGLH